MGRSISWYVLPRVITHDVSKKLCFNWEFQDDDDVIAEQLIERLVGLSFIERKPGETLVEYFNRRETKNKEQDGLCYDYLHTDKHLDEWCPKCHLFATRVYDSPLIIAKKDIHHSYSNKIWSSKYNVKDLYLGSSNTDFARRFQDDLLIREIDHNDVERASETIAEYGQPMRQSDKEAYKETMDILEFLKPWTLDASVVVIIKDEC